MVLEILISTMNRESLSFLDDIFAKTDYDDYKILIINQTNQGTILETNNPKVRVINSFEYGLSKSRNLAIKNAIGDICLIADDDIQYVKGFDKIIKNAFINIPLASIIKFKIDTFCGKKYKAYPEKSKRLISKKDILSASSVEIAFKRQDILDKNILFNINFGLGSNFTSGEEYLFLKECLNKGLIVNFENDFIVKHTFERSTINMGNDNFIKTKVVLYYLENKSLSYLFLFKLVFFLLRKRKIKFKEVVNKYFVGVHAINEYKRLIMI